MQYIKPPETAAEHVEVYNDFQEYLETAYLESGFELSPSEQEDLFQEYFIDQWENHEPDIGNTEQSDNIQQSEEDMARFFRRYSRS